MENQFMRTELLIGEDGVDVLRKSSVIVYGIGGVGSYVVESLARAGIGNITIVDNDTIDITNINRQILANMNNIGQNKVDVMKERILSINPNANVITYKPDIGFKEEDLINSSYDYVVDAIDTITNKIKIIEKAKKEGISIISCTGAGNRIDPTQFEVTDIYKTSICPVAKILRKELKKRNINSLKVLYSKEETRCLRKKAINEKTNREIIGSISFVPSVAGLIIGGEVIKDLLKKNKIEGFI